MSKYPTHDQDHDLYGKTSSGIPLVICLLIFIGLRLPSLARGLAIR
jgi:hypothetical protein